jgi:hypothetical protein
VKLMSELAVLVSVSDVIVLANLLENREGPALHALVQGFHASYEKHMSVIYLNRYMIHELNDSSAVVMFHR